MTTTIFEAVKALKPPPCEKFHCTHAKKCATKLIACKAFQFYVNAGRCITPYHENNEGPNEQIYNKLYHPKDNDE